MSTPEIDSDRILTGPAAGDGGCAAAIGIETAATMQNRSKGFGGNAMSGVFVVAEDLYDLYVYVCVYTVMILAVLLVISGRRD